MEMEKEAWKKAIEAAGEAALIPRMEEILSPPERYLFTLDTVALVQMDSGGESISIRPRREEWQELIPPLLQEAEPFEEEIWAMVRKREEKACFRCRHWIPVEGESFGTCEIHEGVVGRLFGCDRFERRKP